MYYQIKQMVGGQPKPPEGGVMIKEITKSVFEKRFPEVSTYGFDNTATYLEDGTILLDSEWNGEEFIVDEESYKPVFECDKEIGVWTLLGFE